MGDDPNEEIISPAFWATLMEKVTGDHPFWASVRYLMLIAALYLTLRYALIWSGNEEYLRDASFYLTLTIAWAGVCFWALPNIFEKFPSAKVFWGGWIIFVAAAAVVDVHSLITTGTLPPPMLK